MPNLTIEDSLTPNKLRLALSTKLKLSENEIDCLRVYCLRVWGVNYVRKLVFQDDTAQHMRKPGQILFEDTWYGIKWAERPTTALFGHLCWLSFRQTLDKKQAYVLIKSYKIDTQCGEDVNHGN